LPMLPQPSHCDAICCFPKQSSPLFAGILSLFCINHPEFLPSDSQQYDWCPPPGLQRILNTSLTFLGKRARKNFRNASLMLCCATSPFLPSIAKPGIPWSHSVYPTSRFTPAGKANVAGTSKNLPRKLNRRIPWLPRTTTLWPWLGSITVGRKRL
jgi:hypothetical protein